MKLGRNNILTMIFILIVLGLGYMWYSYLKSRPSSSLRSVSSALPAEGKEFLALLKTLESLKLDLSFFQDPAFQSLKEVQEPLPAPSSRGRLNPFLPIK